MKSKRRYGIKARLLTMALLPVLVLGTVLCILASNSVEEAVKDEAQRNLESVTHSCEYMFEKFVDLTDPANEIKLQEYCEYVKNKTKVEITLFLGDTRYATSIRDEQGNLMIGTKASDEVINTVIRQNQTYSSRDVVIGGEQYFAYYVPIQDSDGTVIGMTFAGQPLSYISDCVNEERRTLIIVAVILLIIVIFTSMAASRSLGSVIAASVGYVTTLSEGTLAFEMSDKVCGRSDELGQLGRRIENLRNVLKGLVDGIVNHSDALNQDSAELHDMSANYAATTEQIASTVDELSRAVVSLAENVQDCVTATTTIGDDIDEISVNIEALRTSMEDVRSASDETKQTITALADANQSSVNAVTHIADQVNATGNAVSDITGITDTLNDITSQINLLSLNASIEAARAGEAGKGFAVVADEIRKLADQSSSSTTDIIHIITNLTAESEKTLSITSEVREAILQEKESLDRACSSFDVIQGGIRDIGNAIEAVSEKTLRLDQAKTSVVDNMTNLSAISEENAASVEEASAGCEGLSTASGQLSASADNVNRLASEIREELKFFH